jgi:hypothetical protein
MAVVTQTEGRHWAECVTVTTNGTTAVSCFSIPAGTVVENALLVSKVVGTGTANITVGDDDTADGFILAYDHTSSVGTVVGDTPAERGGYLFSTVGGFTKYYPAAKTCKVVLSGAGTIQGTWLVVLKGYRITPHNA